MIEVIAALIWDKDKFLVCQRPANKARALLWEFVGGKVENGETKEQALILSQIGTQMKDVIKPEKLKERQMNTTSIKWISSVSRWLKPSAYYFVEARLIIVFFFRFAYSKVFAAPPQEYIT